MNPRKIYPNCPPKGMMATPALPPLGALTDGVLVPSVPLQSSPRPCGRCGAGDGRATPLYIPKVLGRTAAFLIHRRTLDVLGDCLGAAALFAILFGGLLIGSVLQ